MSTNVIDRVRRNHALEHATINVLSQKRRGFHAQGNSTPAGFTLNIFGDIPEEEIHQAVAEAHLRLKKGESKLAIHPNCGTVLLTTATMATLAAQMSFSLEQRRQGRSRITPSVLFYALPMAVLAVVVALIVARPVGMAVQANYTVDAKLGDLEVVSVRRASHSFVTRLFQVLLGQSNNPHVHTFKVKTRG